MGLPPPELSALVCGNTQGKGLLYYGPLGRNTRQKSEEQRLLRTGAWKPLEASRGMVAWPEGLPGGIQGQGTQEVTNSSLYPP